MQSVGWNYLSIPKLQRLHRWSLGNNKQFHPTLIFITGVISHPCWNYGWSTFVQGATVIHLVKFVRVVFVVVPLRYHCLKSVGKRRVPRAKTYKTVDSSTAPLLIHNSRYLPVIRAVQRGCHWLEKNGGCFPSISTCIYTRQSQYDDVIQWKHV